MSRATSDSVSIAGSGRNVYISSLELQMAPAGFVTAGLVAFSQPFLLVGRLRK